MQHLFIADAHLRDARDNFQRKLADMLLAHAGKIDTLFILGDLFEFWTGEHPLLLREYSEILQALQQIKNKGAQIIYIEGNHDFSLGKFFNRELGAEVYPEFYTWKIDGKMYYLAHGDIADSGDIFYAILRKLLRSALFDFILCMLPFIAVWRIGRFFGSLGERRRGRRNPRLSHCLKIFAEDRFREGFDGVILAHLHYPETTKTTLNGREHIYRNVGGWKPDQFYLIYNEGNFEQRQFRNET